MSPANPFLIDKPEYEWPLDFHDPRTDRFTTSWTGPQDPRALHYASQHNYAIPLAGYQGEDAEYFRKMNNMADEEVRERFKNDEEFYTGTSLTPPQKWWLATQGEKLRTNNVLREHYQNVLDRDIARRNMFENTIKNDPKNPAANENLKEMKTSIIGLNVMLALFDQLEQMILEEKTPGWDWIKGVKDQINLRTKQAALCDGQNWSKLYSTGIKSLTG